MKRNLFLLLSVMLVSRAQAAEPLEALSVSFESKVYSINQKGIKTLTQTSSMVRDFDCLNNKEKGRTLAKQPDGKTQETVFILNGTTRYMLDPKEKMAFAAPNMKRSWRDIEEVHNPVGKEKVLGRDCQIISNPDGSKAWVWNGIILRHELKYQNTLTVTQATTIQENPVFPSAYFEIPNGFQVNELGKKETAR